MTKQTLGKARGLNSIADPSDFKGVRGRGRPGRDEPESADSADDSPVEAGEAIPVAAAPVEADSGSGGSAAADGTGERAPLPHRAVVPGVQRTRRELSIPVPLAEALDATGINPADVVMTAYRKHADAIYGGQGGRMVSRGRQRLRLSISDPEFDKLTRLGQSRGWNRSETVSVLLAMELLADEPADD